jgi:hypothetical protein
VQQNKQAQRIDLTVSETERKDKTDCVDAVANGVIPGTKHGGIYLAKEDGQGNFKLW